MEIKTRGYDQMMLGGYIQHVLVEFFIHFLIQSVILYQTVLCFVKTITTLQPFFESKRRSKKQQKDSNMYRTTTLTEVVTVVDSLLKKSTD